MFLENSYLSNNPYSFPVSKITFLAGLGVVAASFKDNIYNTYQNNKYIMK
jgi:hypothetical protein